MSDLPASPAAAARPVLEVTDLTKAYGSSLALDSATFSVGTGEMVAFLGQNGAGKSTIVKILGGLVRPSAGTVAVAGRTYEFHAPRDALRRGVAMIPQELAYVPALSAAENIMLGARGRHGFVRPGALTSRAREYAAHVGLEIDLRTPMARLTLAQRQLVEIAKALRHEAQVLLLDEPTAALSNHESAQLFSALGELTRQGRSLILISHRLDEVLRHSDRVITMRDGRIVADRATSSTTQLELIEDMVGRRWNESASRAHTVRADAELVKIDSLSLPEEGLRDATTAINAGEVTGLFGVRGSGAQALIAILAGSRPAHTGTIEIGGRGVRLRSVIAARSAGIMSVPADRKKLGLVLFHSVARNLAFPQLRRISRLGFLDRARQAALLEQSTRQFGIKFAGPAQPARELSGGNQQKVMLAARMYDSPRLLVLDEPSRGVDVAARRDIHTALRQLASSGTAIVFASSDVEEAVALSDRLIVFADGRITGDLHDDEKTEAVALQRADAVTEGA